jgi:uncharacterized membrane protein YgcG
MSVTLEVSQPEMSALKFVKSRKRFFMSVIPETSQSAMGPYVAVAAVGLALNSWAAICREDGGDGDSRQCGKTQGGRREGLVVKVPGGEGGGDGGEGGEGGDGGGSNCTTKDLAAARTAPRRTSWDQSAKEKVCPKPGADHSAPFQSFQPPKSVMSRVHVAPTATVSGTLKLYGTPALSMVPSEQLRLQPTLLGNNPLEQVITEEMVEGGSEGGSGEGGGGGGGGGDGGDAGGGGGSEGDGDGCEGQLPVEGQECEWKRAMLLKAAVPAHAQPMSSLLALDKELVNCAGVERGVCV